MEEVNSNDNGLDRLTRERGGVRGNVTRRCNQVAELVQAAPENSTPNDLLELNTQKEVLRKLDNSLDQLNSEIHDRINIDDMDNELTICDQYSGNIVRAIQSIEKFVLTVERRSVQDAPAVRGNRVENDAARLRLPKLDLPQFTGTYSAWPSFVDLFNGSVDNNQNLSNSQKLFYLKGALKGEPHRLISSLTTTDANYQVARDMLRTRYENTRAIVREHIAAIAEAPSAKQDSYQGLRSLWQTVDEARLALTALGQPMDQMDIFLVYHTSKKMDPESRRQWELTHPGTALQTYAQLSSFMTARCHALEAAHQSNKGSNSMHAVNKSKVEVDKSSNAVTNTTSCCIKCGESHKLFSCNSFRAMDVTDRRQFALEKKLCFNCLKPDHTAKKCQSKFRCKACSAAHNSLLHIDRPAANSAHENTVVTAAATTTAQVLLQTAIIPVHNNRGEIVKCRAMLDTGSQLNLITNSCRSKLELPMHKSTTRYSVVGTGNAESIGKSQLKIQLKSQ